MGGLSIWHWVIVLVIVLLVFGTKRLKNVGKDVGEAIKGFKQGVNDKDDDKDKPAGRLGDSRAADDSRVDDRVDATRREDDHTPR